jgi:hypothetical protein
VSFELSDAAEVERCETALAARGQAIERSLALPAKRSIFLRDPDGQRVEFFARINGGSAETKQPLDPFAV